jgi:hypothetical protein
VSSLWEKITPTESIGKLLFIAPMAICHHLKVLSSILPFSDSPLIFKNMPILFTSTKKYSASKTLFGNSIYEIAGDDMDELFHLKIVVPVMIVGLANFVFVRQIKLIWQNQKINVKNISLRETRISFQALFQALCVYFAHYFMIWDVLLNGMRN